MINQSMTFPEKPSSREPEKEFSQASGKLRRQAELTKIHQVLADLDTYAEGLRAQSAEVDQKYYSVLPEALYHATTREKAEQILTDGLRPSQLQFEDRAVVSLSDTIAYARFCASVTQDVDPSELVLLEVTTQGLPREQFESYLSFDNPHEPGDKLHEVHSMEPIGSDWIHRLADSEAVDIEQL